MKLADSFKRQIHSINNLNFEEKAIQVFQYQWRNNKIYQSYCNQLGKNIANVKCLNDIPFLPISFFKTHDVESDDRPAEVVYLSSGTTKMSRSKHHVKDRNFYLDNSLKCFNTLFGKIEEIQLLALLPSYQQQGNSSLIAMVDHFMQSAAGGSGYFLEDYDKLAAALANKDRKLLIGVSFALLDFCESTKVEANDTLILETGGMKGRRKEITRQELHTRLSKGFGVENISSEYGMTELLSQAYALNSGMFQFPGWAKVLIRDVNDPFSFLSKGRTGGINIIDLANVDSCAFIETQDLGRSLDNGFFEVLGRFDNSDIRGCNLLI